MKMHFARATIALCFVAAWPVPSQAQYWRAAQAWKALGPQVLQCLRMHFNIHGVLLGRQEGIYPNNPRVWSSVYYCEGAVHQAHSMPLHPPVPTPPATSSPTQAGRPPQGPSGVVYPPQNAPPAGSSAEGTVPDQAGEDLENQQKRKEEAEKAEKLKIDALWQVFRNDTVKPDDKIAALLNYSSFGSDSGPTDSFWAPKPGIGEVYVEYQKGDTLQEYERAVNTVNLSKVDPAQFFVKEEGDLVEIVADGKTLFQCSGCNRAELQERWLTYFSKRGH